jgi:hypothetical protein
MIPLVFENQVIPIGNPLEDANANAGDICHKHIYRVIRRMIVLYYLGEKVSITFFLWI